MVLFPTPLILIDRPTTASQLALPSKILALRGWEVNPGAKLEKHSSPILTIKDFSTERKSCLRDQML